MTTHQYRRWLLIGAGLVMILMALWLSHPYLLDLLDLLKDREASSQYLTRFGPWGAFLYLLVLCLQVLTIVIPGQALTITAGYLYGFSNGLVLNVLGAVGASQLAFVIARWAGQPLVSRFVSPNLINRWRDIHERHGMAFFVVCFWFPVIPSNATNYLAGLSSISFWSFFVANLIGRLPGLVVVTLLGAYGIELTWQQWFAAAVVGLVVILGGRYATSRIQQRFGHFATG